MLHLDILCGLILSSMWRASLQYVSISFGTGQRAETSVSCQVHMVQSTGKTTDWFLTSKRNISIVTGGRVKIF